MITYSTLIAFIFLPIVVYLFYTKKYTLHVKYLIFLFTILFWLYVLEIIVLSYELSLIAWTFVYAWILSYAFMLLSVIKSCIARRLMIVLYFLLHIIISAGTVFNYFIVASEIETRREDIPIKKYLYARIERFWGINDDITTYVRIVKGFQMIGIQTSGLFLDEQYTFDYIVSPDLKTLYILKIDQDESKVFKTIDI